MKIETQGYGSSMVATKYVYERINDIVDYQNKEQSYSLILVHLKELQEELAHNYKVDTKEKITD